MYFHRVLLLLAPGLYIMLPLIIDWWQHLAGPWYKPFLVWALLILTAFLIERRRRHNV